MRSERAQEGHVVIDHRESPGVPGLLGGRVADGSFFEAPTTTCRHCNGVSIVNPARTRPRNYCRACDGPICDDCKLILVTSGEHLSFAQKAEQIMEAAIRGTMLNLGSTPHG